MTAVLVALALLAAFSVGFVMYFLPFAIALFRNHRNLLAIGALNLFLGWSIIGWVVALVWALTYQEPALTQGPSPIGPLKGAP
jgi:hypothetical protein